MMASSTPSWSQKDSVKVAKDDVILTYLLHYLQNVHSVVLSSIKI